MKFQPGNQIWKLRSKHGRDKLFASPDLLWEAAIEYFQWCDEHPIIRYEQKKGTTNIKVDKDTDMSDLKESMNNLVEIPSRRPYLIQGLCLYIGADSEYFTNFENSQKVKVERDSSDLVASDFLRICKLIRETINRQKLEGGLSQEFNPTIVARICGLVDKQESKHDVSDELKSLLTPFKVKRSE